MRSAAFLVTLAAALAVTANARTCEVETLSPTGPGSLTHCLERAHEFEGRRFLIKFSDSIAGGLIILEDADGNCIETPHVQNPNLGSEVKKVFIRGPKVGEGVDHISIVAPRPACDDEDVLYFGEDVSVEIERLAIIGGRVGIFVLGTSDAGPGGLDEEVILESVTVAGCASYGVELIDIASVHISDGCKFDENGNDGLRYEQIFGIAGGRCEISIADSEFDRNGLVNTVSGDGADIRVNVVPCAVTIKGSEFDENADDGLDIEAGDGSNGNGEVTISKSEFDDNGFGEGAHGNGLLAVHVDTRVKFCEFDNNSNDGAEIEDATFTCVRSEFDENGDDGLDLDDSVAEEIKFCDFSGNAEYGIELELNESDGATSPSIIENIHKSTLKNNGLGALICNVDASAEARSGKSNETDQSPAAAEKAARAGRGK